MIVSQSEILKIVESKNKRVVKLIMKKLGVDYNRAVFMWRNSATKRETLDKGFCYISDARLYAEFEMELNHDPRWLLHSFE